MRLPHDADGGRDTEKLRYRVWVDVTEIKNSNRTALGLDVDYHTRRKDQLSHSEFIGVVVERWKCMAISTCGRENEDVSRHGVR